MGVYDNVEDAVVSAGITVEEFLKDCDQGVDFGKGATRNVSLQPGKERNSSTLQGRRPYEFGKGFYYNLSVWDVLERLCETIKDDADRDFDSKDYTLSRIHGNLHAYTEYMESVCDFVKI